MAEGAAVKFSEFEDVVDAIFKEFRKSNKRSRFEAPESATEAAMNMGIDQAELNMNTAYQAVRNARFPIDGKQQ
jgi:hypothetical protein